MSLRVLLLSFCCCAMAPAQLRMYIVSGTTERPMPQALDLGTVETGDALDTRFRIRNTGRDAVELQRLSVSGTGFSLRSGPPVPVTLLAGAPADFTVRLQPSVAGAHSAALAMNGEAYVLLATAVPGPTLTLDGVALSPGAVVTFPETLAGDSSQRRFAIVNASSVEIAVSDLAVSGAGFQGPLGASAPLRLTPGKSVSFDVAFSPLDVGAAQGTLKLNRREIPLKGTALEPPLPKPSIVLDPPAPRSGQQARLMVRLAAKVRANTRGQLTMDFRGESDPTVQFLAPSGRATPFDVLVNEDVARFGSRQDIPFQTGTTAGTLTFTVEFGTYKEQLKLELTPQPPALDSATAARGAGTLEVQVAGFDNARSASEATFTFLGRDGRVLGGGLLRVDVAQQFKTFFSGSAAGGLFNLKATFPVKGDTSSIDSVDIELANTQGSGRRNVKMGP